MNGNPVTEALGSLPPSQLAAALNAISGEGVSGAQQTAFGASNLFMSAVMGQATFWRDNTAPALVGITPTQGPMELGPTNEVPKATRIAGYQPRTWRLWATGLGGTTHSMVMPKPVPGPLEYGRCGFRIRAGLSD